MNNRLTLVVILGAAWGLGSAAHAANKPASYAADGKCFCNLPIPESLNGEIVSTPIGGQSLAQVCERVGKGPELKKSGEAYNFSVFDDMQCGHGPGLSGFSALLNTAGMSNDGLAPKWDLEAAYANEALVSKNATNSSNEDVVSSKDHSSSTGEVLRLKSRYIKVPTSSKTAASSDVTHSEQSILKQSRSASPTVAAVVNEVSSEQSAEERSRIEKLPLATVEPIEAIGSSIITTVEDSNLAVQEDSALIPDEVETVAEVIAKPTVNADTAATTAIRVQETVSTKSSQVTYLSVTPTTYDFGGAGVQFSAGSLLSERYGMYVRAALAEDYQELLVGATYQQPLGFSDRLSIGVSGGLEYGRFNLQAGNVSADPTSTGVFVRAQSIFEVSSRFELQGGVGYSDFFEGDPHVFGAALLHMTQKLDFVGEFEAGDNDSAGLGIRYNFR